MARSLIDQVGDVVLRRCWVPDDLDAVTARGVEHGDDAVVDPIWEGVEALYRTGMHPGIQLCIRHEGEVVLDRAIGYARGNRPGHRFRPEHSVPMHTDTPINLFSAAKAVSAMVVHKLEELGALTLDDRVSDHIPEFARHGKGDITIRHVLTHRSGVATWPGEAFDLELLTDHEAIEVMLCELEPESEPGGPPAYHAVVGGFVMEAVARRAAGRSMRDVLATEIRDPLGLGWFDLGVDTEDTDLVAHNIETGLPLMVPFDLLMNRVLGTQWGHVLNLSNDPRFLGGVIPSGNAIVTAHDAATFYQCLLNGGSLNGVRVFEEDTVARAIEHEGEGLPMDRKLGMPMRYSAGFMLGAEQVSLYGWNHPRAFGHVGLSNLFTWADPDRDLVVALLTTGKPVLGSHLVALPQLISSIHATFPETG